MSQHDVSGMVTLSDADLLDWLEKHPQCEVSFAARDEDPRWQVHRVTCGRNDREWKLIGEGQSVRDAIRAAASAMRRGGRAMAADRPIIFSAPMVRALLAGTKTQTRRLLNPQPQRFEVAPGEMCDMTLYYGEGEPWPRITLGRVIKRQEVRFRPGMQLWVRENWKPHSIYAHMKPRDMPQANVFYAADEAYAPSNTPWVPCIHMPRWASRLTLTVTDVRVQRLQEISRGDAMEEGCPHPNMAAGPDPRDWFHALWDTLHKPPHDWVSNPEIVAISFAVERRNIDAQ